MSHNSFPFFKYHGNGNDFVLLDLKSLALSFNNEDIVAWFCKNAPKICDRNCGIGADGIILLEKSDEYLTITVINADGTLAKNCGNGLRCAARWVFDNNKKYDLVKIKLANKFFICTKSDDDITVSMGRSFLEKQKDVLFSENKTACKTYKVSLGNDHLVILLDAPKENLANAYDQLKQNLGSLSELNINFVWRSKDDRVFSEVFERGVGFTKSCASGACASASALFFIEGNKIAKEYLIEQPGGNIWVLVEHGQNAEDEISFNNYQRGSAVRVFEGFFG